ncbi:MAG: Mov34/MPN/PAD-1 family protein [Candidatus Hydrothermarchaeaceae archaeon]
MIVFTKRLVDELLAHADRESPHEACGVMVGAMEDEAREVAIVYECTNVDPDPDVGYEINPMELLRVMEDAEGKGLEIIGFYHSHPMALSRPSMVDESKATWTGHSYAIVSPKSTPVITSWIWNEGEGFVEEEVVVE